MKKIFIFILCIAFTITANAQISLIGINDKILDYNQGNIPILVNNQIYVPYTVFENIGISSAYNAETKILIFYNWHHILTFDFEEDSVKDENLVYYNNSGAYVGKTPYVPASLVCQIFGLKFESLNSKTHVVRISNEQANLSTSVFLTFADSKYENFIYEEEQQIEQPKEDEQSDIIVKNIYPVAISTIEQDMLELGKINYFIDENSFKNHENIRYAYILDNIIGIYINSQYSKDYKTSMDYISEINDKLHNLTGSKTTILMFEDENLTFKSELEEKGFSIIEVDYKDYTQSKLEQSLEEELNIQLKKSSEFSLFITFCKKNMIEIKQFNKF